MHDLAVEQEGDGGEADMGMRPHIDALAGAKLRRPEMVEKDEGADHAPMHVGKGAAHRKVADVHAARHDHEVDRIGGPAHRPAQDPWPERSSWGFTPLPTPSPGLRQATTIAGWTR